MARGRPIRKKRLSALNNLVLLITAGPTVEDIDPVRFISNRSSGRMGVAMAAQAAKRGARVILVHGPLQVPLPRGRRIETVAVRSAHEMHRAVMKRIAGADVAILCAAVADYAPLKTARHKLKKTKRAVLRLELVKTPDILATIGLRRPRPVLVGFAAETKNVARNAMDKLRRKNCDIICANNVLQKGSGFAAATNRITLYRRDGAPKPLPLLDKKAAAARILDEVERVWLAKGKAGGGR